MAIRGDLITPTTIHDKWTDADAFEDHNEDDVCLVAHDMTYFAQVLNVEGSHVEPIVGQIWPRLA